jgi:hypothetical protein
VNLAQARAELAARGFDYLSGARQNFMLNNARNAFEDAWPFPWLESTITGAPPLLIPDLKHVRMVKDIATNRELLGLDFRQVAQEGTDLNLPGVPDYWWLEGPDPEAILHVWPVNDSPVEVWFMVESPELVNDLDEPLIPARYQPIWIDLAVVQAYKDSDNFPAAQALSADVNTRMYQVIERYETRNRQNGHYITMRWPWSEDD